MHYMLQRIKKDEKKRSHSTRPRYLNEQEILLTENWLSISEVWHRKSIGLNGQERIINGT